MLDRRHAPCPHLQRRRPALSAHRRSRFVHPRGPGRSPISSASGRPRGSSHVLAVQATTYYGWDNRFLVDAVRANADWMAGVCTLDPDDPHSPALLEQYGRGHNIRGVRSYQAADGRLDHPGVVRLWEAARRLDLVVSVRINRDKAAELATLLKRFPEPEGRARPLPVHRRGARVREDA